MAISKFIYFSKTDIFISLWLFNSALGGAYAPPSVFFGWCICTAAQWNMWEINTGKCNVCDPFNKLTFTDFCHAVHQTKRTRS